MKEEKYSIKRPEHIVIGDPWYFETVKGKRLAELTVDYKPPTEFAAAVSLSEIERYGMKECIMTMYFAPQEEISVYMDSMRYESQEEAKKEIPVDTARYFMEVDQRKEQLHTGSDGYWGKMLEFYRGSGKQKITDAVIVSMCMPEQFDFEEMKQLMGRLFENVQMIGIKETKEPKTEDNRKR